MGYEMNDLKGILFLLLSAVQMMMSTNIDCNSKAFHCLNSTHFMICVDLGSGVSTTIDDFIIPCPPTTECHKQNSFECEFPKTEVITPQLNVISVFKQSVTNSVTNSATVSTPAIETTSALVLKENVTVTTLPTPEEYSAPKSFKQSNESQTENSTEAAVNLSLIDLSNAIDNQQTVLSEIVTSATDKNNKIKSVVETSIDRAITASLTDKAIQTSTSVAELVKSISDNLQYAATVDSTVDVTSLNPSNTDTTMQDVANQNFTKRYVMGEVTTYENVTEARTKYLARDKMNFSSESVIAFDNYSHTTTETTFVSVPEERDTDIHTTEMTLTSESSPKYNSLVQENATIVYPLHMLVTTALPELYHINNNSTQTLITTISNAKIIENNTNTIETLAPVNYITGTNMVDKATGTTVPISSIIKNTVNEILSTEATLKNETNTVYTIDKMNNTLDISVDEKSFEIKADLLSNINDTHTSFTTSTNTEANIRASQFDVFTITSTDKTQETAPNSTTDLYASSVYLTTETQLDSGNTIQEHSNIQNHNVLSKNNVNYITTISYPYDVTEITSIASSVSQTSIISDSINSTNQKNNPFHALDSVTTPRDEPRTLLPKLPLLNQYVTNMAENLYKATNSQDSVKEATKHIPVIADVFNATTTEAYTLLTLDNSDVEVITDRVLTTLLPGNTLVTDSTSNNGDKILKTEHTKSTVTEATDIGSYNFTRKEYILNNQPNMYVTPSNWQESLNTEKKNSTVDTNQDNNIKILRHTSEPSSVDNLKTSGSLKRDTTFELSNQSADLLQDRTFKLSSSYNESLKNSTEINCMSTPLPNVHIKPTLQDSGDYITVTENDYGKQLTPESGSVLFKLEDLQKTSQTIRFPKQKTMNLEVSYTATETIGDSIISTSTEPSKLPNDATEAITLGSTNISGDSIDHLVATVDALETSLVHKQGTMNKTHASYASPTHITSVLLSPVKTMVNNVYLNRDLPISTTDGIEAHTINYSTTELSTPSLGNYFMSTPLSQVDIKRTLHDSNVNMTVIENNSSNQLTLGTGLVLKKSNVLQKTLQTVGLPQQNKTNLDMSSVTTTGKSGIDSISSTLTEPNKLLDAATNAIASGFKTNVSSDSNGTVAKLDALETGQVNEQATVINTPVSFTSQIVKVQGPKKNKANNKELPIFTTDHYINEAHTIDYHTTNSSTPLFTVPTEKMTKPVHTIYASSQTPIAPRTEAYSNDFLTVTTEMPQQKMKTINYNSFDSLSERTTETAINSVTEPDSMVETIKVYEDKIIATSNLADLILRDITSKNLTVNNTNVSDNAKKTINYNKNTVSDNDVLKSYAQNNQTSVQTVVNNIGKDPYEKININESSVTGEKSTSTFSYLEPDVYLQIKILDTNSSFPQIEGKDDKSIKTDRTDFTVITSSDPYMIDIRSVTPKPITETKRIIPEENGMINDDIAVKTNIQIFNTKQHKMQIDAKNKNHPEVIINTKANRSALYSNFSQQYVYNDNLKQYIKSTNHTTASDTPSDFNETDTQSTKTNNELKLKSISKDNVNLTAANIKLNASSKERTNIPVSSFDCSNKIRGKYADTKDCSKFYTCVGKLQPLVGTCPNKTVFSEINKQCTRNLSHCVRNNQFRCLVEGRFSDFFKDNIYYICVKNSKSGFLRYKFQCQNDYHLNKVSVKCERNEEISSQSVSSVSESSNSKVKIEENQKTPSTYDFECGREGKFPHLSECRKYYICTEVGKDTYRRKIKRCGSEEIFDKEKKRCVETDSREC